MNMFWSGVLGILQGLTEFLPVSSSGHLVLVQSLIPGFSQPGILLDVVLHFGTLLAVLVFFWKDLFKLSFRYYLYLGLATIPAVIVGFLIKDKVDILFSSVRLVGISLMVTGVINLLTHKSKIGEKTLSFKNTFLVGIAQAVAIIPGISRSGSTIFAGVKQGVSPKEAARFSFLLSVPAIVGANILEILSLGQVEVEIPVYLVGFIFAFLAGLLAIKLVIRFLEKKKFLVFSIYCFVIGALSFLL
jgi:undecaprenyl-diphosphatase